MFSPFAGIGSEGYIALQMGRKFLGAELKRSYWEQAHRNLSRAKEQQGTMFDTPQADDANVSKRIALESACQYPDRHGHRLRRAVICVPRARNSGA